MMQNEAFWLSATWQRLVRLKNPQGYPHALLLSANPSSEPQYWTQPLTHWLVCQQPSDQPCLQCRSCKLFVEAHPDVRVLGYDDATISVDDIRELIDFCATTAHFESHRVIQMNADRLSLSAANALLKILEEPPLKVVFLLTTAHYRDLLATIVSRCIRIPIPTENKPSQPLSQAQQIVHDQWQKLILDQDAAKLSLPEIQDYIAEHSEQALYSIYQFIAEALLENKGLARQTHAALAFLDKLKDAMETVKLPGINRTLLVEQLAYQWMQVRMVTHE